jgi:hypothetical protein
MSQPPGGLQHPPQALSANAAPRLAIVKQLASQPRRSWGGRISTACLYAILIMSPLLLGSNRPVFWAANALLTSVALLGLAARHQPAVPILSAPIPILLCAGLGAVMLWMVFQAVPWTPSVLHHFVWAETAAYVHATGAISINPADLDSAGLVGKPVDHLAGHHRRHLQARHQADAVAHGLGGGRHCGFRDSCRAVGSSDARTGPS